MEDCEEDEQKSEPKAKKPKPEPKPVASTQPLIEFPHFLRVIGPKQIKILMQFAPSALIYGLTSAILVTYLSEWKTVLQYLPYYNGKYPKENESKKQREEAEEEAT